MTSRGEIFRQLHSRNGAFVMPNPWDVGSARILAAMGFEALATTSAGMAYSMGLPEGKAPPQAVLAHCRDLVRATQLPVSADLERGFGDTPASVAYTVEAVAETGVAGCSIEDHTGDPDQPIYDRVLAVERIAAASEACRAAIPDMVLTARCENLLWGRPDLDEVIARLDAYARAGADVVYAPGLPDLDAIREVCRAVDKPVNVVMGLPGRTFSVAELAEAGVKRISVGAAFFRLAYGALVDAAREAMDEGSFTRTQGGIGFAELEGYFKDYGARHDARHIT